MFSQLNIKTDTALSNDDASQLILANAIEQLSIITGLNKHDSLALLNGSISAPQNTKMRYGQDNLIDQHESDFIVGLFKD